MLGIGIMIAGIGVGVLSLSIFRNKQKWVHPYDSFFLGGSPLLSRGVYVGLKTTPSFSCLNHGKIHESDRSSFCG
jgi:hypothetical protein